MSTLTYIPTGRQATDPLPFNELARAAQALPGTPRDLLDAFAVLSERERSEIRTFLARGDDAGMARRLRITAAGSLRNAIQSPEHGRLGKALAAKQLELADPAALSRLLHPEDRGGEIAVSRDNRSMSANTPAPNEPQLSAPQQEALHRTLEQHPGATYRIKHLTGSVVPIIELPTRSHEVHVAPSGRVHEVEPTTTKES